MADINVLVVDDSGTMRRIIKNTLKQAGFGNVLEAENGREALTKLNSEKIDLILTDWNMPEMDGLTFVKKVKENDNFKTIPILMITTRSVKSDIIDAMKSGVNNYVVKPFTPQVIKEKIAQVLQG